MEPVTFLYTIVILLFTLLSGGLSVIAYLQGDAFTTQVRESYKEEIRRLRRV